MEVKLNLVGLDGNAFYLLGAFQKAARKQGYSQEEINNVLEDAQSSDYNHLISVLMKNTVTE